MKIFTYLIMIWIVLTVFLDQLKDQPQIAMFDVGQGLSVYFQDPTGWRMLYDGGEGSQVLTQIGQFLPADVHHFDLLILSHPHQDHLQGLIEVLNRYEVDKIWWAGVSEKAELEKELIRITRERRVEIQTVHAGRELWLASGYHLTVYSPLETEDEYEHTHAGTVTVSLDSSTSQPVILLTGDLDSEDEAAWVEHCQASSHLSCPVNPQLLQVSHHGSKMSTSDSFIQLFKPQIAWISVGQPNRYGHPHTETIARLKQANIPVKRTDENGPLLLRLDQPLKTGYK